MNNELHQAPFAAPFLSAFSLLAEEVFGSMDPAELTWRLTRMPEVTVFITRTDEGFVGFKAGYAMTMTRYYSWLGGVKPSCRRRGIAEALMRAQHDWVRNAGYGLLETHVLQNNQGMIALNEAFGLQKTGEFLKNDQHYQIMQKPLAIRVPLANG